MSSYPLAELSGVHCKYCKYVTIYNPSLRKCSWFTIAKLSEMTWKKVLKLIGKSHNLDVWHIYGICVIYETSKLLLFRLKDLT